MKFKIKKQLLNEAQEGEGPNPYLQQFRDIENNQIITQLKVKAILAFTKVLKGIAWLDGSKISFEEKPEGKDYIISDDDFDQQTIDLESLKNTIGKWQKTYQQTDKYDEDLEASQKAARAQADAEEKATKEQDPQTLKEVEADALEKAAREEATKLVDIINDYYYNSIGKKQATQEAVDKLQKMSEKFVQRQEEVTQGAEARENAKKQKEKQILNKMSSVSSEIKSLNAAASGEAGLDFDLNDFKKVMKAMVNKLDDQERKIFKEKIFADSIKFFIDDKKRKETAETGEQTAEKQKGEKPIVDAMKILNNFTLKDGENYKLDDDFIRDHKDEIKNAIKLLTKHLMVLQETLRQYKNNILNEARPKTPPSATNNDTIDYAKELANVDINWLTSNSEKTAQGQSAKKPQFDINDKQQILTLLKAIKVRLKKIESEDSSKDQAQKAGEQEKAAKGKILNDIITILDFFKDDVEIGKGFEVAADKKSWFGLGKNKRQAQADQIAKEWKGAKSFVKYLADNLPKIDQGQKVALIRKYGDTIAKIGEIFGESNITNFVSLQESKKYKLNLIKNKRG